MKRVLVPLVDGFEEIEAITSIDILRRAGIEVTTAGIGGSTATGSHAITVQPDVPFDKARLKEFDLILLPGGPGTKKLGAAPGLQEMLKDHAARGKPLAAICAAPTILAEAGLLEARRATCYPSVESSMRGALLSHDPVVVDGSFITSRGAGTAVPFALAVVEMLLGKAKAEEVAHSIVYL